MYLPDINRDRELMELARTTLLREKQNKQPVVAPLQEIHDKFAKADYGKNLYEVFEETIFESKISIDMIYYKNLLRNLDETFRSDVEKTIVNTYKLVKEIYEFVNIKPELYGKGISINILEESIDNASKMLSGVLVETIDTLFYKLTPQERYIKYSDKAVPLAKKLITEQNKAEDAIQFSIKSVVMEDILTKIAFPFLAWGRVKYLSESEDFGKVFDQDKLFNLVENFEKNISVLAKYVAASV